MRAVNLVPSEQRGGGSRTGVAVYVFLGVLGAIAVGLAALVLTNNQIDHRRAELTKAQVKATAAEAEAKALKPYSDFATLRKNRVQTVESLAKSRFDWPRVLHDLSRAMPRSAWVQTFNGTVTPGASAGGGGGSGLRGALAVPAVELSGCATSQSEVARMMTRLRLIEGVTRVSLGSSQKADLNGGAGTPGAGGSNTGQQSGCSSPNWPQFDVVLFFEKSIPAPPTAPTATTATAATATTTGTTTTPAAGQTATTPTTTTPASGTQTTPAPATGASP
jgi:Tfp pilus assembly protein PilN